jgi:hypothetical protein
MTGDSMQVDAFGELGGVFRAPERYGKASSRHGS